MTTGPAEIFDLGYRGYEGERTSRWRRRRAIWRDGVRISLGLGRSAGAKFASWLLIGLALVPIVVLVVISAFLSPAEEATEDFELPSYAEYYEWAIVPLGAVRGGRRPAAALSRPPRRRAGALRGAADHPDRLRRLPLGGLPHGLGGRGVAPGRGAVHVERARRARAPARGSATTGTSLPRFLAAAAAVAALLTTLSLFTASYAKRRAYAAVATLAVLFVGSAIGGIAEENFTGAWPTRSRWRVCRRSSSTPCTGSSATTSPTVRSRAGCPPPGSPAVTIVLAGVAAAPNPAAGGRVSGNGAQPDDRRRRACRAGSPASSR